MNHLAISRRHAVARLALGATILVMVGADVKSWARAMKLMNSYPAIDEIMNGSAFSFALHFDGPVDHARSRLILVTPDGNRTIHPRLSSQPNTLYGTVGELPPGDYELQWNALAMDGEVTTGSIPFHVKP